MPYTRALKYRFPLMRGDDVLALQHRLKETGHAPVLIPDGLFGADTRDAVLRFQRFRRLAADGIAGSRTWTALFESTASDSKSDKIRAILDDLQKPHSFRDSVTWQLSKKGILIAGEKPETTGGKPLTVKRIWGQFGDSITEWSETLGVPAELIIATICTETGGDPTAVREEPGYVSDEKTPHKVSPGLTQTLISTARAALGDDSIDRAWLLQADNAIRAGAAYIALSWKKTHFDPPKVACAYNAGGVYYNQSEKNRWKMRQYPINSAEHANRFTKWFNDCFLMFEQENLSPDLSYFKLLRS
ncbi:MAG: peptidoglycan-binding protein [Nitrospiria bacterium]